MILRRVFRRGLLAVGATLMTAVVSCYGVQAQTLQIVALGASNTVGRDGTSYPAELEAMLKARGYNARVINAGVNGDTTVGMLARLGSAVPDGTKLVLLNPANANDKRKGVIGQQPSAIASIRRQLQARNIKVIVLPTFVSMAGAASHIDEEHFSAAGYRAVAARVLPQVTAVLGRPR